MYLNLLFRSVTRFFHPSRTLYRNFSFSYLKHKFLGIGTVGQKWWGLDHFLVGYIIELSPRPTVPVKVWTRKKPLAHLWRQINFSRRPCHTSFQTRWSAASDLRHWDSSHPPQSPTETPEFKWTHRFRDHDYTSKTFEGQAILPPKFLTCTFLDKILRK